MKQTYNSQSIIIVLLAVAAIADGVYGRSRKLQQLCHPQRGGGIITPGVGGFFTHPEIDGVKVDYCLNGGSGCGKQAADAFCKSKGLAFSDSYVAWPLAGSACGKTVKIGSKDFCTGSSCTGFRVVSCAGTLVPDILGTIIGESPKAAATVDQPQEQKSPESSKSVDPPASLNKEAPIPGDTQPREPISQSLDLKGPGESTEPEQDSASGTKPLETGADVDTKGSQEIAVDSDQDSGSTLASPDSADGSGEGSEADNVIEAVKEKETTSQPAESDKTAGHSSPDETASNSSEDKTTSDASPDAAASDLSKDTNASQVSADDEEDDGIVIDHPDLGDVILPGQGASTPSGSPSQKLTPGTTKDEPASPPAPGNDQDALFCQERGAQSASAAARSGCGSVISQCGTDASITRSQENPGGVAGRRLLQSLVDSKSCRKLFADECQAAAFDNASGLCATLMGDGPNPGEERPGCATAEEAREIFRSAVNESCGIFMAGAFP